MNPLPPLSDASLAATTARQHWCVLYLLGELTAEQSAALEQQIAASPTLADQLAELAETLLAVADVAALQQNAPPTVAPVAAWRWPQVAAMLAMAASVMLIWAGVRFADTKSTTAKLSPPAGPASVDGEDLLIAQAWVDSLSTSDDDDAALIGPDPDDALASVVSDETPEIDSALSWMVIAVAADLDLQAPEPSHGS